MNFADSNWLEAVYIAADPDDREGKAREQIVERFARKHGGGRAALWRRQSDNRYSTRSSTSPSDRCEVRPCRSP
jgi:hypothetical protein